MSSSSNSCSDLLWQARAYAAAKGWLGPGPKAKLYYAGAFVSGHITEAEFMTMLKAAVKLERKPSARYRLTNLTSTLLNEALRLGDPVQRVLRRHPRKSDKALITDVFANIILLLMGWSQSHGLDLEGVIKAKVDKSWTWAFRYEVKEQDNE